MDTLVLACVAALAGAAFQAMDDAGTHSRLSRQIMVGLFVAMAASLVAAGALVGRRAGEPARVTVIASALVFVAWLAALWLFDASPLRRRVGYVYGNEAPRQLAFNGFAMRLFLCWATTIVVAGAALLLARRRQEFAWAGVAAALGLASAAAAALGRMGGELEWVRPPKWAKLASTALLLLLFVALVRLLAGAMRGGVSGRSRGVAAGGVSD